MCGHEMKANPGKQTAPGTAPKPLNILELMAVHIKAHPDHHREFGLTLQVFASFLLSKYCEIPETEKELLTALEGAEQNLMEIFGFEVEAPK
jgi:hypothetical protein